MPGRIRPSMQVVSALLNPFLKSGLFPRVDYYSQQSLSKCLRSAQHQQYLFDLEVIHSKNPSKLLFCFILSDPKRNLQTYYFNGCELIGLSILLILN